MTSVKTRQIENYKFFSTVYATKQDAIENANEGFEPVKCFKKYGDPADGWMNCMGDLNSFQEDYRTN